jgi:hypothetical protein
MICVTSLYLDPTLPTIPLVSSAVAGASRGDYIARVRFVQHP